MKLSVATAKWPIGRPRDFAAFAACVRAQVQHVAEAGAHIAVLPEYLCWLLNQPAIQNRLQHDSRGSNIPMLGIGQINELRLPIAPVNTQTHIVALAHLAEQEQQTAAQLQQNRQTLFQGIYQHLIKESQS